jgi:hypothetical protein
LINKTILESIISLLLNMVPADAKYDKNKCFCQPLEILEGK